MKRSKNVEHRVEKALQDKQGLMTNIEQIEDLTMNFQKNYHGTLLETDHFEMTVGNKKLIQDLNLKILNQGIVSLEGKNGSGKSAFLKILLKKNTVISSNKQYQLVNGLNISYLPQDFTNYHGNLKEFADEQRISYEALLNNLKKMGFPRESFTIPIENMSMGQQKRVAIAKSLVEPADLYLWDEPANYLDVFNQDQLIKLLKMVKPAMLLIEHDEYFIEQVAQERVNLDNSQN